VSNDELFSVEDSNGAMCRPIGMDKNHWGLLPEAVKAYMQSELVDIVNHHFENGPKP
jgi:hypothetical protein